MKRIYKYEMNFDNKVDVVLPVGAKILSVCNQRNIPVLYVLIDDNEVKSEPVSIYCYGTGHPAGNIISKEYISTCSFMNGSLMFHFFK